MPSTNSSIYAMQETLDTGTTDETREKKRETNEAASMAASTTIAAFKL